MLLSSLLRDLPDAGRTDPPLIDIEDIAYDSRAVQPGSLFVAVPTVGASPSSGGHQFIDDAIRNGAVAVVTEVDVGPASVPVIRVPNARAALADLAATFFDHPSRHLHAFAITGTDGKTTTSYLLESVLSFLGCTTGLLGTIETKIGEQRISNPDRMTTPESLDLQRTLHAMVESNVTHVALEASSHALALQRLRSCHFKACALTNVTGDHVEFHGSWDAYVAAKLLLFSAIGSDAPAILNRDDESFEHFASVTGSRTRAYSGEVDADIQAGDIEACGTGSRFHLISAGVKVSVELPLPGLFNVLNALAATGLALEAGAPLADIAAGLSQAQSPPGRMQRVECGQPFNVIVDYGHTPNAFRSVLSALRQASQGRLIAVFGATGNRDRRKRPVLAQIAHQYADFFIITNEDPFDEDVEAIMAEVAAGAPPSDEGVRFRREPERTAAIRLAIERAGPGDTVVILGKGHESSIVMNGQKQPWSDVGAARAVLADPR